LGGPLVLPKSVLSSLSVYALSFFKAPAGIVFSIESILIFFFGSVDHRKITWVDWNSVCRSKEVGGLGVRRIREFNTTLLGKWCWWLLVERNSFWFRVMAARYGVAGGRLLEGGRNASTWWRDISALRREEWFSGHISRSVRNGKHTLFLVRCVDWWSVF
jgi:hypothetical protein